MYSSIILQRFQKMSLRYNQLKKFALSSQSAGAVELISRQMKMHRFELLCHLVDQHLVGHRLSKCQVDLHVAKELSPEQFTQAVSMKQRRINCKLRHKAWTIWLLKMTGKLSSQKYFHTTLYFKQDLEKLSEIILALIPLYSRSLIWIRVN